MPDTPTKPAMTPMEEAVAAQYLAKLAASGQQPTAHNATAPADQKFVAWFDDKNQLNFADNPNYQKDAPKTTVYGGNDTGYFILDANGQPQTVVNPNPDALIEKAIDRENKERLRNQRAANEAAGRGYATDDELHKRSIEARTTGVSEETLKQRAREFEATQKAADARDKVAADKARQDILESQSRVTQSGAQTGLIGAQTTRTGAETKQIEEGLAISKQKAPYEIEEMQGRSKLAAAQVEKYKADIEEQKRKAGLPTVQDLGTGPTYATQGPGGEITEHFRQGYVPKTIGEVQARVGQIAAAANAKAAQLQAKVGQNGYTAEQADAEFRAWHDQNVSPYTASLQAAQEEALFARGKEEATQRVANMTAAQAAGRDATNAFVNSMQYRVGPRAAEVMNQVGNQTNTKGLDMSNAAFWSGPDPSDVYKNQVADALKYISPTAAAISGAPPPNYAGMDIAAALNATNWRAPTQSVPAGPAAGGGVATAAPAPAAPQPWMRADQNPGPTPAGNAMAPNPGMTGTVPVGAPQFLGSAATPDQIAAAAGQGYGWNDPEAFRRRMIDAGLGQYIPGG